MTERVLASYENSMSQSHSVSLLLNDDGKFIVRTVDGTAIYDHDPIDNIVTAQRFLMQVLLEDIAFDMQKSNFIDEESYLALQEFCWGFEFDDPTKQYVQLSQRKS